MVTDFGREQGSHFAVTIGINRYTLFQPLVYAQQDAQAMWAFLVKEADISIDRCLLMTDTSSSLQGYPTCPTRDAIQDWVNRLSQQAKPGDTIWCFFSGYGVCYQGQDYLMPIDGNPADIPNTGIAIHTLFKSLKTVPGVRVIVLLDMNRSQAMQMGVTVGSEALTLAQHQGICLFLSCQPDEFSHETSGHGLFTTILMKGLRHPQCRTPQALGRYLAVNLPKLGSHYSLPSQHPMVIVSREQEQQHLLPDLPQQTVLPQQTLPQQTELSSHETNGHHRGAMSMVGTSSQNGQANHRAQFSPPVMAGQANSLSSHEVEQAQQEQTNGYGQNGTRQTIAPEVAVQERSSSASPFEIQWSQTAMSLASTTTSATPSSDTLGGDSLAAFNLPMSQTGYLQNGQTNGQTENIQTENGQNVPSLSTSPEVDPMNSADKPSNSSQSGDGVINQTEETDSKFWSNLLIWGGVALVILLVGVFWRNANGLSASSKPKPSPTLSPTPTAQPTGTELDASKLKPPADPALVMSFNAMKTNQPDRALELLDNLPPDRKQSKEYIALHNLAEQRLSEMVLSEAREMITLNQASRLRSGIDHLQQKIQPNDPLYEQVKQDIDRWSLMILDIAEGRASKGDYEQAIAAARQVPESSPETYQKAQQLLAKWQKQASQNRDSQKILEQAMARAKGEQASAYNQAIQIARQIQPDDPLYQDSEKQVNTWSQRILTIARARTEEGKFKQAMAALRMVPNNTGAKREAQQEIEDLSRKILGLARSEAAGGNYRQAIALVRLIPATASPYRDAQTNLLMWQNRLN